MMDSIEELKKQEDAFSTAASGLPSKASKGDTTSLLVSPKGKTSSRWFRKRPSPLFST